MAICSNCGQESKSIISRWRGSVQLPDKCKYCSPEDFGPVKAPSEKKIWVGPEFAPNDYEWRNGEKVMKPEAVAELESKACGMQSVALQEELQAIEQAEAHKRATRRTKPLTPDEISKALEFVDKSIRPLVEDPNTVHEL